MGVRDLSNEKLRKYPRREFKRKIGVLFAGVYDVFESIEISEGGLSFYTDSIFTQDRECVLNFQIPSGEFVSVRGVIKRMTKSGSKVIIGVSFQQMAFSNKRQIRNYVASREAINN